jgi:hypothetical protein
MRLLAPLPLGDALEIVDVPADELGERGRSLLDSGEGRWILKSDFAVLRPAEGGGAVCERTALAVQDYSATTDTTDRRVTRGSVGLPASFDCRHDGSRGDMTFLSPLRLPGKR